MPVPSPDKLQRENVSRSSPLSSYKWSQGALASTTAKYTPKLRTRKNLDHDFLKQVVQGLQRPLQSLDFLMRNLFTNPVGCHQVINKPTRLSSSLQNPLFAQNLLKEPAKKHSNVQSVRGYMRVYYKPSAWKRYNKHNIEKRLCTPGGIEVLWRRVLKGRHNLAVYERILPGTVNSKVLEKHQMRFRKHPLTKQRLPKPGLF